jgi:hypothetical protein
VADGAGEAYFDACEVVPGFESVHQRVLRVEFLLQAPARDRLRFHSEHFGCPFIDVSDAEVGVHSNDSARNGVKDETQHRAETQLFFRQLPFPKLGFDRFGCSSDKSKGVLVPANGSA